MRQPVVAGTFYPEHPQSCLKLVQSYLDKPQIQPINKTIRGMVSPHAGYLYSGLVAGYGFKCLIGQRPETIVIVGPSHHHYFPGVSIYDDDAYKTPLGTVPINRELVKKLRAGYPEFVFEPLAHNREHGIEVQLPFLQTIFKDHSFSIVPMVVGDQKPNTIESIADAIEAHCDPETTVFLASSDFSHFYSDPEARQKDLKAIDIITKRDPYVFETMTKTKEIEMCGSSAICSLMLVMDAWKIQNTKALVYANSGDVSGDKHSVVGYSSIVFY